MSQKLPWEIRAGSQRAAGGDVSLAGSGEASEGSVDQEITYRDLKVITMMIRNSERKVSSYLEDQKMVTAQDREVMVKVTASWPT